jgi:phosphoserine phosphatase
VEAAGGSAHLRGVESGSPSYQTVFFDCDSTLSTIEGIDELAREYRDQVVPLTEAAMRGEVSLESVYARRLAIIRPSRQELARIGALYVETLVPGAVETIGALQAVGVRVYIISGGLLPAIRDVAVALGVPPERVFAVDVTFDASGAYAGFDESSPLARQGGKPALVESLGPLPRPSMLVGDGATDLEARRAVDTFVAFAGVEERAAVVAGADVVIRARSLLPVLTLALGDRPPGDAAVQSLIDRGRALLTAPISPSPGR